MSKKIFEEYDDVFDFIEYKIPDWEKLITDGHIKIKTNQNTVQFALVEEILQKFNLRITDISFSTYYGVILGIEKI